MSVENKLRLEKKAEDPEIRKDYLVSRQLDSLNFTDQYEGSCPPSIQVFKDTLSITQDDDIVQHKIVPPQVVRQYEKDGENGPDLNDLHLDMKGDLTSKWNVNTISLLTEMLKVRRQEFEMPERLQEYMEDLIQEKMKCLRVCWKADLPIWKWLEKLIKHLGADGMSSEESGNEGDTEDVLHVKAVPWGCDLENELSIIDRQRMADTEIFLPRGSRPMKRLRGVANSVTQ
ncbi:hypothetical protein K439DRAFT_1323373 [Ramaria rubella]|nr:hypothetical protein K439DRAFT_1323373 [Ramaria rubella]